MTISVGKRLSRRTRRGAFTLLEIMIVLAIGTLVLGGCIPAFLNWSAERKLRSPVTELANFVSRARFDSLSSGNSATVRLTDQGMAYGKRTFRFDPSVKLRVRSPQDEDWRVPKEVNFVVFPSGLCEPWLIEFSLADGSYLRNRVDPLTGFLEEEESFIR